MSTANSRARLGPSQPKEVDEDGFPRSWTASQALGTPPPRSLPRPQPWKASRESCFYGRGMLVCRPLIRLIDVTLQPCPGQTCQVHVSFLRHLADGCKRVSACTQPAPHCRGKTNTAPGGKHAGAHTAADPKTPHHQKLQPTGKHNQHRCPPKQQINQCAPTDRLAARQNPPTPDQA